MSYWCCAQIESTRERLALHCLSAVHHYEIYSPRIAASAKAQRQGVVDRPLFPGYVFVWIVAQWWQARWSPGVIRLVLADAMPARVPDAIIDGLRKRERDGLIHLPRARTMQRGDPVRIVGGAFTGHLALYAGMKPRERVEVLLAMLGAHQRVVLPKRDIVAVRTG
jgi:transcriptional antiterminator RfaH